MTLLANMRKRSIDDPNKHEQNEYGTSENQNNQKRAEVKGMAINATQKKKGRRAAFPFLFCPQMVLPGNIHPVRDDSFIGKNLHNVNAVVQA